MHILKGVTSNILCCFDLNGHDGREQSSSPKKAIANKDTPISISVNGASVPHTIDSPEILQKIFASNASQRGYNAVYPANPKFRAPQGSLDFNFRFGGGQNEKKPGGRLEQLTQHVKQKLSESRLSQPSVQAGSPDSRPGQGFKTFLNAEPDVTTQLLGRSQTSIGLTELLASRAASEGGYDSDAKSIQTPTMMSGRDTLRLRTQTVRQSIATVSGYSSHGKSYQLSSVTDPVPETSALLEDERPALSKPSEAFEMLPFPEALQMSLNEVQSNETSKPNDDDLATQAADSSTVESKVAHAPSGNGPYTESEVSPFVHRQGPDEISKEGKMIASNGHQVSSQDEESASVGRASSSTHQYPALIIHSDPALPQPVIADLARQSIINSSTAMSTHCEPKEVADEATPKVAQLSELKPNHANEAKVNSNLLSDQQSLHLFDMRISQRLASSSLIPMLSSTNISNESSDSATSLANPIAGHKIRASSISRGPTFITMEHNRCPSDPETRKLFENPTAFPTRKGKRSFSDGSIQVSNESRKDKGAIIDDSSSYYGSIINEITDGTSPPVPPRRRSLLVNTHSLAIGGRSASGPVPHTALAVIQSRMVDGGHDEMLESSSQQPAFEAKQEGNTFRNGVRTRATGTQKPSRFIKIDSTPTPVARRFKSVTDGNETMSEIGMESVLQDHHAGRGSESTQAVEDRRNENFSNLDYSMPVFKNAIHNDEVNTAGSCFLGGREIASKPEPPKNETGNNMHWLHLPSKDNTQNHKPGVGWQDNTSDVWLKAFRRVGGPEDRGNLLETPQFDREGRRRSSIVSLSDVGPTKESSPASMVRERSQSVNPGQHGRRSSPDPQKKRHKSVPALREFGLNVPHKKSYTLLRRTKLHKSSLADLGRRVMTSGFMSDAHKSSKEGLGIWGRFASHTREQRNGAAGQVDDIKIRDFGSRSDKNSPNQTPTQVNEIVGVKRVRSRASWNLHALKYPGLKRQNTRSMILSLTPAERAKYRRKGVVGRLKRLYRTKSSELQMFTTTQGHRGSISTGLSAEYPELECLPREGAFSQTYERDIMYGSRMDGTTDQDDDAFLDTISEVTSKRPKSMRSYTLPWRKRDAEEWSKLYQDCIGSLSALKSDDHVPDANSTLEIPVTAEKRILSSSSGLRESTVNFQAELQKNTMEAKERLLRQLQSSEEPEKHLRMPGSFV